MGEFVCTGFKNSAAKADTRGDGMRKRMFGHREAAVIGLGSADFGGRCGESLARELMDAYVAIGGNLIDTARVYGDFRTPKDGESEKVIGRWMADRHCRDQIFLSTKGAHPRFDSMRRGRLSREEIRRDMDKSLQDLQTDRVDIYWLHRDDESRAVGDILETLQGLIEEKRTVLTGVSNWRPERILTANAYARQHGLTPIFANQPQFSLARQAVFMDDTLVSMDASAWRMHRDTGMACCCFSSQAHGFFTKLAAGGEDSLPGGVKKQYLCPENLAIYERLLRVKEETGLSVGAIALAYLTSQPFPTFALAGASRLEHVWALREAGDAALTEAQREFLWSFSGGESHA